MSSSYQEHAKSKQGAVVFVLLIGAVLALFDVRATQHSPKRPPHQTPGLSNNASPSNLASHLQLLQKSISRAGELAGQAIGEAEVDLEKTEHLQQDDLSDVAPLKENEDSAQDEDGIVAAANSKTANMAEEMEAKREEELQVASLQQAVRAAATAALLQVEHESKVEHLQASLSALRASEQSKDEMLVVRQSKIDVMAQQHDILKAEIAAVKEQNQERVTALEDSLAQEKAQTQATQFPFDTFLRLDMPPLLVTLFLISALLGDIFLGVKSRKEQTAEPKQKEEEMATLLEAQRRETEKAVWYEEDKNARLLEKALQNQETELNQQHQEAIEQVREKQEEEIAQLKATKELEREKAVWNKEDQHALALEKCLREQEAEHSREKKETAIENAKTQKLAVEQALKRQHGKHVALKQIAQEMKKKHALEMEKLKKTKVESIGQRVIEAAGEAVDNSLVTLLDKLKLSDYLPKIQASGHKRATDLKALNVGELQNDLGMKKPQARRLLKYFAGASDACSITAPTAPLNVATTTEEKEEVLPVLLLQKVDNEVTESAEDKVNSKAKMLLKGRRTRARDRSKEIPITTDIPESTTVDEKNAVDTAQSDSSQADGTPNSNVLLSKSTGEEVEPERLGKTSHAGAAEIIGGVEKADLEKQIEALHLIAEAGEEQEDDGVEEDADELLATFWRGDDALSPDKQARPLDGKNGAGAPVAVPPSPTKQKTKIQTRMETALSVFSRALSPNRQARPASSPSPRRRGPD